MTMTAVMTARSSRTTTKKSNETKREMIMSNLSIEQEFITPEMAHAYLGYNLHNRNLREARVLAIARDIKNGDWRETGETIKFATNGSLLDGQHRLAAITVADVGINVVVVRNVETSAQEMMDAGAKRTFGDLLKLRGETNTTNLAAVLRLITAWERGERGAVPTYTNAELLATLEKYPEVREMIPLATRVGSACRLAPSFIACMWWVFRQIDVEDADAFFEQLGSDIGHSSDNPVTLLRRQTLTGERPPVTYGNRRYTMATVIKAWNAFRDGAPMHLLSFRPGGSRPEQFPVPR